MSSNCDRTAGKSGLQKCNEKGPFFEENNFLNIQGTYFLFPVVRSGTFLSHHLTQGY